MDPKSKTMKRKKGAAQSHRKNKLDTSNEFQGYQQQNGNLTYRGKLRKLYDFYAQLGEPVLTEIMKKKKFMQFCTVTGIIDDDFPMIKVDLIVARILTKNVAFVSFENFVKLLDEIAKVKCEDQGDKYFKYFLDNYPIKYYSEIFEGENNFASKLDQMNFKKVVPIEGIDNVKEFKHYDEFLEVAVPPLFSIYKYYFIEKPQIEKNYYDYFFTLCRDFNVFPDLIAKDELNQFIQNEIKNVEFNEEFKEAILKILTSKENMVNFFSEKYPRNTPEEIITSGFSFFRFLKCLLQICSYSYDKYYILTNKAEEGQENDSGIPKENLMVKVCFLLEKMKKTKGFAKVEAKPYKLVTILTDEFIETVKNDLEIEEPKSKGEMATAKDTLGRSLNFLNTVNLNKEYFPYEQDIIEKYKKELEEIFNFYATDYGVLKRFRFIKLLNDCGFIEHPGDEEEKSKAGENQGNKITKANAEILFTKIGFTSEKAYGKLPSRDKATDLEIKDYAQRNKRLFTFQAFINCIEPLSKILFPSDSVDESIDSFCNVLKEKVLSFVELKYLDTLTKIDQQKGEGDFGKLYEVFSKYIEVVFDCYKSKENTLPIEYVYNFCYDFKLFPNYLTKQEVFITFRKILKHFNSEPEQGNQQKNTTEDKQNASMMSNVPENELAELTKEMFCYFLLYIAMDPSFNKYKELMDEEQETDDLELVIRFTEKLANSRGMEKHLVSLLDKPNIEEGRNFPLMLEFKENFPQYFEQDNEFMRQKSLNSHEKFEEQFADVLDSLPEEGGNQGNEQ